jgi:Family of unknown function (DUF6152)
MPNRRLVLTALFSLATAGAALAHHGWGSFDRTKVLEHAGPVKSSSFANPHGVVVLVKDNADLTIELAPVARMTARGLAEADIAPGKVVKVHAYQNTQTPTLYRAEWIEVEGRRIELR